MNKLILAVLIAAFLLVLPVQATIYVGGEAGLATISEAIAKASENETIIVREGIYKENIEIDKPVSILSYGGASDTVIEAKNSWEKVAIITANKVTISGFTIRNRNSKADGIYLDAVEGCNILDNNIYSTRIGIYLLSSSNNKISHNTVNLNDNSGIFLGSSNDNLISNNTANSNKQYHGIELSTSNNNNILDNNASNNFQSGIALFESSNNNTIKSNTVNLNNNNGIYIGYSHNNFILNNTANSNKQYHGIELYSSNNNSIIANNASNNLQDGIRLEVSNNNTLRGNIVNSNKQYYGVELNSSNNNVIVGNTVNSNNNGGIYMVYSRNNSILNNTANLNKQYHGIELYSSNNNAIIENNASNNFQSGIALFKSSNNNSIKSNTANLNNDEGVRIKNSHNNSILNNTVCVNGITGIYIDDSSGNEVSNNIFNKNLDGIRLTGSTINKITNNNACENGDEGISLFDSSGNEVSNNIFNKNMIGIILIESNDNEITNNNACANELRGISIEFSSGNEVSNNIFNKNCDGIVLIESNNNEITNNNACENGDRGLGIYDSSGNDVSDNIFNKNLGSIFLFESYNNIIKNNTACENRDFGIALEYSSTNDICNNIVNKNSYGIILIESNNNEITNNNACENGYGLRIEKSSGNEVSNNIFNKNLHGTGLMNSNTNEITNNNIVESKGNQARIENSSLNKFSYNYWSDYEGEDKNKEGIGDEPYEIEGIEQESDYDHHPYMNYSGWLNVVITPEYWEFYTKKGDVNYFYKNFSIQNRLNSHRKVEILLDENLSFEADSKGNESTKKTFNIDPKSTENVTLRLNVTNLEGYILRKITFKTEDYTKTTMVNGYVQPKIHEVKIEGVDFHRNVVQGQINPFYVILQNYGDKDEFYVTLRMGSEFQKSVYLNETEKKTVPFEIDTTNMPLGITKGQVVVSKDKKLDYLDLSMFVASKLEASTLIVTNLSRFTESKDLMHKLIRLTHHPAVNGILLDVKCNYTEFDSNYNANHLCKAIKKQITEVSKEYPNIKYLIIAGDDRVIPFYRIHDGTTEVFTRETGLPDEREYYKSDHYPNPVSESIDEALSSNHFLTDDFYSTLEGDRVLAVGRLVEKPDEIIRAIDMFFNYYQLTPTDVFVTSCETPGYEFMYDGSEECYHEWRKRIERATDKSKRINTTFKYRYKKGSNYAQPHEIIDGICNSSVSAIFLHANYDLFEVPPGEGGGEKGYLKAGELKTLNGSVIYSIGCHAGLTIPNVNDLPQSFLSTGTIAYIAPTGYGLGGVITVAGHERLLEYLTKRIARGEDVGFALLNAKSDYYLDNFHMDTVDDKVLRSLTLYGFPMYTVRLDSTPQAKSESACTTPLLGQAARKRSIAALGGDTLEVHAKEDNAYTASNITLEKVTITLEPTYNVVKTENGTYYYTYEGYTTEAGMPILPKATLYFIRGEKEIRGMVLRSAKFDVKDTTLVVETFAVSGTVGRSYNFTGWYPTIPFTLNSIEDRQSIVTASAQYKLIKRVSINAWQGTIRLFNETVLEIFRVPESADREKPEVSVAIDKGTVTVKAEDNAGIYDVFVTYLGPGNRTWASKTMDKQDRGELSVEYRIQLNNTAFFVQVVDVDGNVEIDDNNGDYYVC